MLARFEVEAGVESTGGNSRERSDLKDGEKEEGTASFKLKSRDPTRLDFLVKVKRVRKFGY